MNTFFISDTHFHHFRACEFMRGDGQKLRPFSTVEEMNETMVANWNKVVNVKDTVYHLGDVTFGTLDIMHRLRGTKILIRGNHDDQDTRVYFKYFKDVLSLKKFKGFVCTHVPIHPTSIHRWRANVHGHLHDKCVGDHRYLCVSVEQTDYTPITLEEVRARLEAQKRDMQ